jgi:RepB DNA-primase from phage plasmid
MQPLPEGETRAEETRAGGQAQAMLDAFASVGAHGFDLTLTDAAGRKVGFHPGHTIEGLCPVLEQMLRDAATLQHNMIVRPRTDRATLVQLDDLDASAAERMKPASFLILCTSPGSYQAWVAVDDADADFARRLKKGAGADPAASGATRISGSLNFKEKYAPAFPRVETVYTSPGLVVPRDRLEALGVVAPPERTEPVPPPARALLSPARGKSS